MGLFVTRPRRLLWGGRFQCQEGSMDFRTIRYEKLGAVLRITANRPEVLNAQSRVMILELDEAFRAASEDDETRVIIVADPGARLSAGPHLPTPRLPEDPHA